MDHSIDIFLYHHQESCCTTVKHLLAPSRTTAMHDATLYMVQKIEVRSEGRS